ncbi:N-acetylglucosamine-specific PTS transporter subunit IIBC [Lacrimispora sp. 210928-DFI.3.58]|uniref:N-acetylglucosamine-specific PTS transporter subunit IIBC n=1 Tax=Lacrimispora sp. 210928-DFI.3.58 TaxID=2883214 RepID=UPI001D090C33|nr:N-acetylglucosamine-specific PTS transporter subunit IIBC [Lacrimispora sp. 210928-DFI.3.58]MCB7319778.1 N-acetylglucosamine-specific PTS transporter subunit IIBC [Lacrimispora sp. 210928-DFI.3.58]
MKYLQKLGKAIMLPVAVLPVAAIMMGIGYFLCPSTMQGGDVTGFVQIVGFALVKIGAAVIDYLPMLFAVGVAIGLSKDQHGAAGLAGLVAFLTVTTVLNSSVVATIMGAEEAPLAFSKINNAFIGILSGITAAACYNKYSKAQLPTALAFFSGKRCVPIVTSFVMVAESVVLYFIWPLLFNALVSLGKGIMNMGPLGAGIYAFANRLLIPTGLHHALNAVFWFDIAGIADINKFWGFAEGGVKGVTGMYQAGFFPVMMFGLPAAALAMYHTAKPGKKQYAAGILVAGAVASFVSGVTEPLEFAFMFLAPGLYVVHAVLTGISVAIAAAFHWTAGFCFSAGVTDFIFSCRLPMANQPFMLLVEGVVFAVIYYVVFRAVIVKFNLPTPGREEEDLNAEMAAVLANDDFTKVAAIVLEGLGGKENVASLDNCITRLRMEVKDYTLVDEKKIKSAGVAGVMRPSKTSVQVIIGTKVQFVADEMKKML